ncbi:MAG TPA: hypothetical protein VN961_07165, partial [Streptosporangiaceae bacterium]|nr:hypothetical protein [Streptosporangiaceae bacterium]
MFYDDLYEMGTTGRKGALPGAPEWHDAESMEASESGLLNRGYGAVLWQPDHQTVRDARITRFMNWLAADRGHQTGSYEQLWQWSVARPEQFWAAIWDYFEVLGDRGSGPV